MASHSNSGSGGWKSDKQNSSNSGTSNWISNLEQEKTNGSSCSGGWAFNSGQGITGSQSSRDWGTSKASNTSGFGSGGASGWATGSKKDSGAPGGWQNTSDQGMKGSGGAFGWTSGANKESSSSGGWQNKSGQQEENPINWDGLVEDVFKKEIGQMAEDMKGSK